MEKAFISGILVKTPITWNYKKFFSSWEGMPIENIWLDIRCLQGRSDEKLRGNYPTQKPEANN